MASEVNASRFSLSASRFSLPTSRTASLIPPPMASCDFANAFSASRFSLPASYMASLIPPPMASCDFANAFSASRFSLPASYMVSLIPSPVASYDFASVFSTSRSFLPSSRMASLTSAPVSDASNGTTRPTSPNTTSMMPCIVMSSPEDGSAFRNSPTIIRTPTTSVHAPTASRIPNNARCLRASLDSLSSVSATNSKRSRSIL